MKMNAELPLKAELSCSIISEERPRFKFEDVIHGLEVAIAYLEENSPIAKQYVEILNHVLNHVISVHGSMKQTADQDEGLQLVESEFCEEEIFEAICDDESRPSNEGDPPFNVDEQILTVTCDKLLELPSPRKPTTRKTSGKCVSAKPGKRSSRSGATSRKKKHRNTEQVDVVIENGPLALPDFPCPICSLSCKEPIELQKHFQTHEGQEQNFCCVVCGEKPGDSNVLKKHLLTHKVFSCHHCGKTCSRPSYLRQHLKTHTGERPYACTYCEKRFTHSNHLKEHEHKHTGKRPFQCPLCVRSFTWRSMLHSHMKGHNEDFPYKCDECEDAFKGLMQLKIHKKIHKPKTKSSSSPVKRKGRERKEDRPEHIRLCKGVAGSTRFFCSKCKKGFNKPGDLQLHFQRHEGEELKHECVFCGDRYDSAADVHRHVLTYKPFMCTWCDRGFHWGTSLRIHLRTHTGERPYSCKYCRKTFAQVCHMKEHVTIHTGEKLLSCNLCGKSFRWEKTYKYHMERHENEQSYKCSYDQCERAFSTRDGLTGHINRIHKGIRPVKKDKPKLHMCSSCGKSFSQAYLLKKHESAIHAKEHPYSCPQCDRTFAYKWSWVIHVRRHVECKPQPCTLCGKIFNNLMTLTTHMRHHTREKKYPCDECDKTFTYANHLKRHKSVHTGAKPFMCPLCGRRFTRAENLQHHNKKLHGLVG